MCNAISLAGPVPHAYSCNRSLDIEFLSTKLILNTVKYHVSCTDGKISVRINLLFYLFFQRGRRQKKLQHPTRPVENVALTTKGLEEIKTQLLNGTTVEK